MGGGGSERGGYRNTEPIQTNRVLVIRLQGDKCTKHVKISNT